MSKQELQARIQTIKDRLLQHYINLERIQNEMDVLKVQLQVDQAKLDGLNGESDEKENTKEVEV